MKPLLRQSGPTLLLALVAGTGHGTDSNSTESMRAPSSPAFALVGVAPTRIERPASPRALGLSLLSATSESSSGIPRNLAFEFAPYWWTERPTLTFNQMEGGKPWENVIRTASFSIATFERAVAGSSNPDTGAGVGLHFDVIRGKPTLGPDLSNLLTAAVREGGPNDTLSKEKEEAIKTLSGSWDASRVGHQLSMATAASWRFKEDKWENGATDRIGGWITYAYKSTNSLIRQFTFLGTGRVLADLEPTAGKMYWDLGARLLWRAPSHPITISGEYMRRLGDADSDSLTAMIQYEIKSGLFVFASHGGQLEGDRGIGRKMTLLGLSFGWGPQQVISR